MVAAVEAAVMAAEGTPASPPRNGGLTAEHSHTNLSFAGPTEQGDGALHGDAQMREHSLRGGPQRHWSTDDHTIDATYLRRILNPGRGQGQRYCPYSTKGRKALSLAVAPSIVRTPPHPRSPSRGSRHI